MSSEQLSWHLPGKWSAAEVLEHLYLTYTGTTRGLEKVLTRGASLATKPSMAQRVLTFMVVRLGYVPAGRGGPRKGAAEGAASGAGATRDLGKACGDGCDDRAVRSPLRASRQAARPPDSGCADCGRVENAPSGARTAPPATTAPASQTHVGNALTLGATVGTTRRSRTTPRSSPRPNRHRRESVAPRSALRLDVRHAVVEAAHPVVRPARRAMALGRVAAEERALALLAVAPAKLLLLVVRLVR